jgi:hypothetical protein
MPKASTPQRYYTLADQGLAGKASQGDTAAQTVLEHRRAVQRMCTKAKDTSSSRDHCCCLTEEVRLHFRKSREMPKHVRMFLEIGELTSLEAVKQQWEEIRTWRDLLLVWQGPAPSGTNELFYQLHLEQRQERSYAAIAARLNLSMRGALETYVEKNYEIRQVIKNGTIRTVHDFIQWQQTTQSDTYELGLVQSTLQKYGFPDNEIQERCLGALENLILGADRRRCGVLFTRDWVISKLRSWRAKNQFWLTTGNKASHRMPNT